MFIIYKCKSPSGKAYIGMTRHTLNRRMKSHYHFASSGINNPFQSALRKYGDKCSWSVIASCETRDIAYELEIKFIAEFQTQDRQFGYNIRAGGGGFPPEITVRNRTPGSFAKGHATWNKGQKGVMPPPHNKGKLAPESISARLKSQAKAASNEAIKKTSTAVLCVETGETFSSQADAARKTGCQQANISRVCSGFTPKTKNLTFRFVN